MADNSQKSSKEKIEKAPINNPIVRNNLPRFLSDGATKLDNFGNATNQGIVHKPYIANVLKNHPTDEQKTQDKIHIKASTISSVEEARKQINSISAKNNTLHATPSRQSKPKSPGLGRYS